MIYLFVSIFAILIGFLVVTNQQKRLQSQISQCSICEGLFSEVSIHEADELPFCSEHIATYIDSKWIVVSEAISTPEESEEGIKLYETKLSLWRDHLIPTVIKSSYELNGEVITSKLSLFVRDIDLEKTKEILK